VLRKLVSWPEYLKIGGMLMDFVTWIAIHLLQFAPLLVLFWAVDEASLLAKPNLPFWIAVALALWVGSALGVMAFGAAGSAGRLRALALHLHVRGFFRAGGDAVKATNAV